MPLKTLTVNSWTYHATVAHLHQSGKLAHPQIKSTAVVESVSASPKSSICPREAEL